ncbi:MAG: hypothetical protein NZ988_01225 [Thaumarchaeota archaeon]|nr:hypothetical protein [Candidatus Calditenuaceae archaeon]MDW8186655.1 hypothetical protein [Nitrososphaerota archaeon]
MKQGGRRIAQMGCKRKFFVIATNAEEGWKRLRVKSQEDYDRILEPLKRKPHAGKALRTVSVIRGLDHRLAIELYCDLCGRVP